MGDGAGDGAGDYAGDGTADSAGDDSAGVALGGLGCGSSAGGAHGLKIAYASSIACANGWRISRGGK